MTATKKYKNNKKVKKKTKTTSRAPAASRVLSAARRHSPMNTCQVAANRKDSLSPCQPQLENLAERDHWERFSVRGMDEGMERER